MPAAFKSLLLTAILGISGALIARSLGLPAPFLVGPAALVTLGSLSGLKLRVPMRLRDLAFLSVGLSMGAGVTPQVIAAAWAWPASFLMLITMSALLLFIVFIMLRRLFAYDAMTALLGACPGHLSYVLSLAAGVKSDLVSVGVVQSVRVLALTLLVPLFVEMSGTAPSEPVLVLKQISLPVLVLMALPAFALGLLLQKWRVPAALLVGGMLISSGLHVSGLVEGAIPAWLQLPVYIVLGSMIGARFSGVRLADLSRAALAGSAVTLVAGVVSVAAALLVSLWLGIPLAAALIAFAPGGLETMAAMAVILHADPAYVGTHHIVRLVFLSFLMPAMIAWVRHR
ncbi:AbrB family transcriptional regulator [Rhizobium helianthi]|uniref:AbrB family transcriptional regulator n=1 Tax=Rhizobium helianthi TaxID=1132695 RepID=A0ABW4M4P2_9HYPH